jgi:acyl-CoA thioester hydrolase
MEAEGEYPPGVHREAIRIAPEDIDRNDHVNNVVYVRWMQDLALRHARSTGGLEATLAEGATWVVRSHHVEYRRPAGHEDAIEGLTWVAELGTDRSLRRFLFRRVADDVVLVRAETQWVCVDAQSGRPRRIPEVVKDCFVVLPEFDPRSGGPQR